MFKNFSNIFTGEGLVSIKENLEKVQKEMGSIEDTGEAGAGLIKITLNGNHKCTNVQISPELLEEEKEIIEQLIQTAINTAAKNLLQKAQQSAPTIAAMFKPKND